MSELERIINSVYQNNEVITTNGTLIDEDVVKEYLRCTEVKDLNVIFTEIKGLTELITKAKSIGFNIYFKIKDTQMRPFIGIYFAKVNNSVARDSKFIGIDISKSTLNIQLCSSDTNPTDWLKKIQSLDSNNRQFDKKGGAIRIDLSIKNVDAISNLLADTLAEITKNPDFIKKTNQLMGL